MERARWPRHGLHNPRGEGILARANAPVQNQSLAEASLPAHQSTQRHHHKRKFLP